MVPWLSLLIGLGSPARLRAGFYAGLGVGLRFVAAVVFVFGLIGMAETIKDLRRWLRGLHGPHHAEIMFGVLQITLRHHAVARGTRVPGQLQIFFVDCGGVAAHFHIRPRAFKAAVGLVVSAGLTTPAALTLHRRFTNELIQK